MHTGDVAQRAPVVLASLELLGIASVVDVSRVLFVPTAANSLPDRRAVIDAYRTQLLDLGCTLVTIDLDVTHVTEADLTAVDGVFCSGGDPYRLLAAVRRSSLDRHLPDAMARGLVYMGASAGALVAGPSLGPIRQVTPFERPAGLDVTGIGLASSVVLPHDDHPGRRALHAAAQRRHGRRHHMIAITDSELFVIDAAGGWRVLEQRSGHVIRPAQAADVGGIAATVVEARRKAWDFLSPSVHSSFTAPVERWAKGLDGRDHADQVIVLEDHGEIAGVVAVQGADDPDLPPGVGEVAAVYTRPGLWVRGAGRRLLTLGLDHLRAMGYDAAVLYIGERNARARRIYERSGWRTDTTVRERTFVNAPIRELRYRLAL